MKSAFVLGGSGFIGPHVARLLSEHGWDVTIASRGKTAIPEDLAHLRQLVVDRSDPSALRTALDEGTDVLIDVIPYKKADAQQLIDHTDLVGGIVAISSASVYADDDGRTLDGVTSPDDFPRMPVPIAESQSRAEPGDGSYSTRKAAIEDVLLGQDAVPACVIRPCAVYGPGDTQCRESYFVKRALDGRGVVLLGDEGESVFHTTSVHNLAELVRIAAEKRAVGAFNCGDPDPPNVRRIASSIADAMGHEWREIPLTRDQSLDERLHNPWLGWSPWLLDMSKATRELGYEPVTSYNDAVPETIEWITGGVVGGDWREVLPKAARYLSESFDYAAEDKLLQSLGK